MRAKMSRIDRAKQFMPFSPLSGLERALAERARIVAPRPELTPDAAELLDRRLRELQGGETVTAVWYTEDGRKTVTDTVVSVDVYTRTLILSRSVIGFDDLYDIR